MKPTPLKIEVPNPCLEPWDKMQSTDGGKYCGSCAKNVTDFSGFTDQELISYFKNRNAESCGRFRLDQLQRELYPSVIQKGSLSPRYYWLAGVLGFAGLSLQSQSVSTKVQQESCQQIKPILVFEGTLTYRFLGTHFHGQAVDKDNNQLSKAIITYFQGNIAKGILADDQGRFTIQRDNYIDTLITLTVVENANIDHHISMIQELNTVEIEVNGNELEDQIFVVGKLPYSQGIRTLTLYRRKGIRAFFYKVFHLRKWIKYKRSLRLAK